MDALTNAVAACSRHAPVVTERERRLSDPAADFKTGRRLFRLGDDRRMSRRFREIIPQSD
jgi:hypothetical protein